MHDRHLLEDFNREYSLISSVFLSMRNGNISNIEAKDALIKLFQIQKQSFINREYIELDFIFSHLNDYLCSSNSNWTTSTIKWKYNLMKKCLKCNTNIIHQVDCIDRLQILHLFPTVQETIDNYLLDQYIKIYCLICDTVTEPSINTIIHPNVLHIMINITTIQLTSSKKNCPFFLDKFITVDNVIYDILGAIYGDGTHFVYRYIYKNMVYECDGMETHAMCSSSNLRRAALSVLIDEPYETAMSYYISLKNKNGQRSSSSFRQPMDIYYLKRL